MSNGWKASVIEELNIVEKANTWGIAKALTEFELKKTS
jgi:hypothetical protein